MLCARDQLGNRRPSRLLLLCICVVVQVGFGGYGIVLKQFAQSADINPLVLSVLRDLGCTAVLMSVAALVEGWHPLPLRHVPFFAALALFGMFLNQWLYIQGTYLTTANIASVYQPLIPIFTAILSIASLTEPFPSLRHAHGWLKMGGVLLGSSGAVVMLATQGLAADDADSLWLGNVCLLGNTAAMAVYVVLMKRFVFFNPLPRSAVSPLASVCRALGLRCCGDPSDLDGDAAADASPLYAAPPGSAAPASVNETPLDAAAAATSGVAGGGGACSLYAAPAFGVWAQYPITVTAWCYFYGSVLIALASVYLLFTDMAAFTSLDERVLVPLAYAVFVTSSFCYGLITYTNKYLDPSLVTAFWPVQVMVTIVLSYIVFGDVMDAYQWLGGGIIVLGLLLVTAADYLVRRHARTQVAHVE